ncbi:MAG: LPS export ABC transporter periplasmic protein LptC [Desulfobulbaceae bacterium]|nr:MAG: LPS export ABC transporter periplasmic protein LptC [Desulfobulbaceae bacterium]
MMRGTRNLLWLLPLLMLLGWPLYGPALVAFLAPPQILDGEVRATGIKHEQRLTMEEIRFFQQDGGARQWRIDSDKALAGKSKDEILFRVIDAVFFRDEREQAWIVADTGRFDPVVKILELEGNVRLRNEAGFWLETPALRFYEKEDRVRSQAGVVATADNIRIQGQTLDYDLATGRYTITGNVKAILKN